MCVCVCVCVCACACVCVLVALVPFLEDLMCRQATCRQMEALHIVAVNIIASLLQCLKDLERLCRVYTRAFTDMASIYPWVYTH